MTSLESHEPSRFEEDYIWECYNSLMLSHDLERIRKLLVRYDLFRMSLDVPGDIVECGVFKGVGLMYWLKLIAIFSPGSRKQIIGFDTFGKFADSLLPYERATAEAFVSESKVVERIDPASILKRADDALLGNRVEIVEGDIQKTAIQYVESNPGFRISLLHLDLDAYAGTKAALDAFYPAVSRSGVIILDEYASRGWGESDAVDEFLADKHLELKVVPFASKPTAYIIKL